MTMGMDMYQHVLHDMGCIMDHLACHCRGKEGWGERSKARRGRERWGGDASICNVGRKEGGTGGGRGAEEGVKE